MRGFLDPDYPSRTDYRSVLDRLIVALDPARAFGFGSSVQPIGTSLGTLGNKEFYSDNNTEMEAVFDRIGQDSMAAATHLIIGDGRRTEPDAANEQYVRMRQLAREWIGRGGTFLVAASQAPFETVPGDPAGCRTESDSASATCPLYAFAFIAAGDEARVVSTFASANAFDHVFVWPLPAAASTEIAGEPGPDLTFEPRWGAAADSSPIARVRGRIFTNQPHRARLELAGASDAATQAVRAAHAGQALRTRISVRPLNDTAQASSWQPTGGPSSLVREVADNPQTVEFLSRGATAERHLYKVELYPTGEAPWIDKFDAQSAGDEVRTYGLGRLFELFPVLAQSRTPSPVQRAYVVVN